LAYIHDKVIPTIQDSPLELQGRYPSHGNAVLSKLDIKYQLTGRFKICSVRTYKKPPPVSEHFLYDLDGNKELCNIAFVTTWAPRMCGIATFSAALRDALLEVCPEGSRVDVVVVKHKDHSVLEYNGTETKFYFNEYEAMEYIEAAQFLNKQRYRTVLVQYEFGMLAGDNLVCMLRELKAPNVLTTIHTVHNGLSENMHSWMLQAAFLSRKLVVMTHSMRHALSAFHAVPTRDVAVVPHGGPDLPYERFDGTPLQTLFPGKKVILSNGLLHQMKGIEIMIRAMPRVLEEVPNAVYLVHGKPHPSGVGCEEYYQAIMAEANWTAPDNIFFNRSFALTSDLHYMLKNTRVYVNAYTDTGQSVSGTLAMALGLGTVAVSTPYSYAVEMLRNNTGRMVPFHDVNALAEAVIDILKDDENHARMSRNAYDSAQQQTWRRVAKGYLSLEQQR
jgi:glycosyltransferase involved in cell wall biosynthesis